MTDKLRRGLAAYHIIGALAGLISSVEALPGNTNRSGSLALVLASVGLFASMGAAGILLARQHRRGPLLASAVQAFLLPMAATPWLTYKAYGPVGLTIAINFLNGAVNLEGTLGAGLEVQGHTSATSAIVGINMAALCALILVLRSPAGVRPLPESGGLVTR